MEAGHAGETGQSTTGPEDVPRQVGETGPCSVEHQAHNTHVPGHLYVIRYFLSIQKPLSILGQVVPVQRPEMLRQNSPPSRKKGD